MTHMNGYPPIPPHMPIPPLHIGMPMGMPINYGVDYQAPSPTTTQLSNLPRPSFLPNRPEPSSQNRKASGGPPTTSSASAGPLSVAPTTASASDSTAARPSAAAAIDPKVEAEAEAQEGLRKKEAEMREALRARLLKKQGEREAEAAIQKAMASLIPDIAADLTPTGTNESTTPTDREYIPYVPQAHTSSLDAKLLHPMVEHTPPDTTGVFSAAPSLTSILRGTDGTNTDTAPDPDLRPASRRGIKRPTADDFIDDSGPNKRMHLDNSEPSDFSATEPLYKRSTTASFTQFNAARPERVVIHLSEDDEEGGDTSDRDTEMKDGGVMIATPSRTDTPQQEIAGDQRKSELQEKLRLMKELLQQKEAERLQRLQSGTTTESQTPTASLETAFIGTGTSLTSTRNGPIVSVS